MRILLLFLTFVMLTPKVFGQENENDTKEKKEKFPAFFAIQIRGLMPNKFSEPRLTTLSNDTMTTSIFQKNGFSFGGVIRQRYTDALGIETGLNISKRYYDLTVSLPDSGLSFNKDFAFNTFELPVNGLVFVKLSNTISANAGLGASLIYKPSSVGVLFKEDKSAFSLAGISYQKFNVNINAQFGFEYGDKKRGIFYLGGSAHISTQPLFAYLARYSYANSDTESTLVYNVRAPFFTVDVRYYFPSIRNKGSQPLKGPIE